ncbi:hypothetical protein Lfu02_03780 [Longispora fulva]|uniref:Acyl carrier protein n=1 Tax=Longispora fulva TaxID=619741 RepID=A0A8J7G8P6_9ACTN|nr:hypothetical protein [Longispora fulva]MBG6135753.1 acyl carrier protein [Longispora fulva]GIG56006.1 hypothetical protein Lfu02_03780 [Longispora fulva]
MDDVVAWIRDRNPELARTPAPDEDLIEGRVIDSLAFLEFIYLLEELTGRPIDLQSVTIEDFRTLATIERRFFAGVSS